MSSEYEDITVRRVGRVEVITISRPKVRNALRLQTFEELSRAYEAARLDDEVRSILFTGEGDKAFSSGADLGSSFTGGVGQLAIAIGSFHRFLDRVETGPKLSIAALNGDALGGGLELAMACHIRIADPACSMGLTETNVGIFPAGGGTQRLPRLIGVGRALAMIVFGQKVDAREAQTFGLVQLLASGPGRAFEEGLELAEFAAQRPPIATATALRAILVGLRYGHSAGLEVEREGITDVVQTEDAMEGIRAFFEKRDPEYKGR